MMRKTRYHHYQRRCWWRWREREKKKMMMWHQACVEKYSFQTITYACDDKTSGTNAGSCTIVVLVIKAHTLPHCYKVGKTVVAIKY